MKNFEIKFKRKKNVRKGFFAKGHIKIKNFIESFYASLIDWTISDYKKQWHEAIDRLKHENKSMFITSIGGLTRESSTKNILPCMEWWCLYKINDKVHIQNFLNVEGNKIINKPFNAQTCYQFIAPRTTHTEEGDKVSEWVIDLKDILAFDPLKQ